MTDSDLENVYREHLEEDIILNLHKRKDISLEDAMDMYYKSKVAKRIHKGEYGIQYLDSNILIDMIEKENENRE